MAAHADVACELRLHSCQSCPGCRRKDANDVLMQDGKDMLRACIQQAQPLPVKGLFRLHEFWKPVGAAVCWLVVLLGALYSGELLRCKCLTR